MLIFSDVIGFVGVSITLGAYFLLNIRKISSQSLIYSSLNALGSALILYSLWYVWNMPTFIMEFIWLC